MNYIDALEREKVHSDQMKGAAEMWMQRCQNAERTLAIVVYAAGAEIVVAPHHIYDAYDIELTRYERPDDMTTRFRAKVRVDALKAA